MPRMTASSDELFQAIVTDNYDVDWAQLRKQILAAEDVCFSVEQSSLLAPRLLTIATYMRDCDDQEEEPVVWSAIRTGSSMLRPHQAHLLLPLLDEYVHPIETELVAVKMLGRIFEVQPPLGVDLYPELANEVCRIAKLAHMHLGATEYRFSFAKMQLAIYALAAMACSEAVRVAENMSAQRPWFVKQVFCSLERLQGYWANCPETVDDGPLDLLRRTIDKLQPNTYKITCEVNEPIDERAFTKKVKGQLSEF